ncbi:MAG: MarR family transcriptional regulator [Gemmatimonadota bacterium]|nr:MarR family transcriptional regulator [Gemmatimonadota bacterium]MDE3006099.1 MarR family transcriptional regulator [Gemmatimonadota bacterium]MDE3013352.1 MarR family transcriptional regulator [Gemmatimonadota bacterium]
MPASTTTIQQDLKQSKPFRSRGQEAYVALLRTADDSKRFLSRLLDADDVTLQQYNVLRILRGAGDEGLPTLSVAERMVERTPGVTRLIDRMEKKGWVTRERGSKDRRRVWCMITSDGLSLLDRLDAPIDTVNDLMSAALNDEELRTLTAYLDRIRARLGALDQV